MSAFDLGIIGGMFTALGIQSLIYVIVGMIRRDHDSGERRNG